MTFHDSLPTSQYRRKTYWSCLSKTLSHTHMHVHILLRLGVLELRTTNSSKAPCVPGPVPDTAFLPLEELTV